MRSALELAKLIPDNAVQISTDIHAPHQVQSLSSLGKKEAVWYRVWACPFTVWGCCSCNKALEGDLCQHQVAVMLKLRPGIEPELLRLCGTLQGSAAGGLLRLDQATGK